MGFKDLRPVIGISTRVFYDQSYETVRPNAAKDVIDDPHTKYVFFLLKPTKMRPELFVSPIF
jgi:hypothetical protein